MELHCPGGFILTALYRLPRTTSDLAYGTVIAKEGYGELEHPAGCDSKLTRKHKVYFQHAGGINDLPEDHEERFVDLHKDLNNPRLGNFIRLGSKLTRNTPKDCENVEYLASKLPLSFKTLYKGFASDQAVDREARPARFNPERSLARLR